MIGNQLFEDCRAGDLQDALVEQSLTKRTDARVSSSSRPQIAGDGHSGFSTYLPRPIFEQKPAQEPLDLAPRRLARDAVAAASTD